MSNRLSNYTGKKYTLTIGEIAARGTLAAILPTLLFDDNTTFMTGDQIGDILADYTRKLYVSMTPASESVETDFISTLTSYWNLRKAAYKKMYAAAIKNYDPLSNYDMQEEGLDGKKLDGVTDTNTRTGSMTETETPTGTTTTTTTPTGGTKRTETPTGSEIVERTEEGGTTSTETESRTTYDDTSVFEPTIEKQTITVPNDGFSETTTTSFDTRKTETTEEYVQNTKTTVTETFTNRQTATTTQYNQLADTRQINNSNTMTGAGAGGSVTGMHEVDEHFLTRSGNIGVTTSQQMLESELKLRYQYNLYYMFMREFITRYTY